jgi:hypothetical protein
LEYVLRLLGGGVFMAYDFKHRVSQQDIHNILLKSFGAEINNEDLARLGKNKTSWNFYDGYHWEAIGDTDKPQVTVNYVRAFVDKFVAFELGKGFNVKMKPEIESIDGDNDPLDFINDVWEYNNKLERCIELGQSKSITGNGWIQVSFDPKFDSKGKRRKEFIDPFDEFEKGKIVITVLPDSIVFPIYEDAHDKDVVRELRIMYPVTTERDGFFGNKQKTEIYKQVWTNERVKVYMGKEELADLPNKYGIIPFRQVKNYPAQGKNEGISDVEDIIPINTEINLKKSDISEIIDYHSAPVTVVFGARIGQLERGANKVWGGLPKDARIENLRLEGDLTAAQNYVSELKREMHEVGSVPEGALGGDLAISNTSGVALQISLKPILDRVQVKQVMTKEALQYVNKLILLVGLVEGLIEIPQEVEVAKEEGKTEKKKLKRSDFFYNEVSFESTLPKDTLLELQELELELKMGLESREGAMKRRGKANIQKKIAEIDEDMEKNPKLYGKEDIQEQIELMKEQSKIQKENSPASQSPSKTGSNRPVGTNKEGKPKQVNAGFQNSPQPKK